MKKNEMLKLIHNNIQEMIGVLLNLEEETIRWHPATNEWSIMQIISHVGEAIPYWIDLAERLIKNPDTKINRYAFSKNRLYAVSEEINQNMDLADAIRDLERITVLADDLISSLSDEQFQRDSVQYILDIEVAKHIEIHIHQINRNIINEVKHKAELRFDFLKKD